MSEKIEAMPRQPITWYVEPGKTHEPGNGSMYECVESYHGSVLGGTIHTFEVWVDETNVSPYQRKYTGNGFDADGSPAV